MPRLLRSVLSVSGANAVNGVLGLLVVPVALRCVGAEGYGLFAVYGVIASYVALSDLGVSKHLLRTLAASTSEAEQIHSLRTALTVYLGLGLVLIALIPPVVLLTPKYLFSIPEAQATAAGWIGAMALVEYVLGIPISMMQSACVGQERFERFARFNLASGVVRYALLLGAFAAFGSPIAAAVSQAARRLIDFVLAVRLMGGLPAPAWKPRLDRAGVRTMVAESSTLSIAQILYLSTIQVPSLLVNWSFGLHALGIYRAVYDLSAKVFFFGNVMGLVLFPRFAKTKAGDRFSRSLPSVLQVSWNFYAAIACAAAVAAPLVLAYVGIKEPAGIATFPMICLGLCLNAHGIISTEALQAARLWPQMTGIALMSLAVLAVVFYGGRCALGFTAIGVAWIGAQASFALLADHTVLKARALQANEWTAMAFKLAALALCCLAVWPDALTAPLRLLTFSVLLSAFLYTASPLLRQIQNHFVGRD